MKIKLGKKALAVAMTASIGAGFAGHASADVYGVGYLDIDNFLVVFSPLTASSIKFYTFSIQSSATLDGAPDPVNGDASCNIDTCTAGDPILSGTVQNAPSSSLLRGENDYAIYGTGVGSYSNAESSIIDAQLVESIPTNTEQIAESNISGPSTSAQADTTVNSNTTLELSFQVSGDGAFSVTFDAILELWAEVTGESVGSAQTSVDLSIVLSSGGTTLVSWAPDGTTGALTGANCTLTCTITDSAFNLNRGATSNGAANGLSGNGSFGINVTGLTTGTYNLALSAGTDTDLGKRAEVPVPSTLFLLGTGLLFGAGAFRRRKS